MRDLKRGLGGIAGLFLVTIFAACMLLSLAAGAGIYQDISEVMERQYSERTASSYLVTRVRQFNSLGMITVGELEGCQALILRESGYDGDYLTYIYCWNGYLRELYCPEGESLSVTDGETVIAASSVSFLIDGGVMRIECTTDGGTAVQYVSLVGREAEEK
ncbi:MAG: DUF4860 domain-containing protein [Oscillospiraceae bacterium]